MAGTNAGFDARGFEEGIRFAMQMGAPTRLSDRATFHFPKASAYPPGTRLDREGRPLDPTIRRTETPSRADEVIDCAIEFEDQRPTDETPVGRFTPTRVTLTCFEKDYDKVRDAREVSVGGDRYIVAYRPPPLALFNVGFQQIVLQAKDET